ncbi:MAG: hypothetical protein ACK40K_05990 [Raineya sp.]
MILFVALLSQSCKKKCRDVQSNQAPFRTYTVIPDVERDGKPTNVIAEADSFFVGGRIVIESLVENAVKYEWKLQGDPTLKEGKKLALYFQEPSVRAGDSLEIMSIVTRKPNPECIAGDDGVDTLIKKIYFIDFLNAPFAGTYRVHDEINNPNKFYEISIRYVGYSPSNPPSYCYRLEGEFLEQQTNSSIIYTLDYPNCFSFTLKDGVWGINPKLYPTYITGMPYGYLSPDRKSITIEGTFIEEPSKKLIKFKYTGKRTN